jgi:hypothetical protein
LLEHHKTQSGFTDFEARARLSGTRAVSQSDRDRERDFDQQRRQIHGGEKTGGWSWQCSLWNIWNSAANSKHL